MHIISADQRLSQSPIWDIQRQYFLNTGMAAWQNDVVPHSISCSPYMARMYADVVFGYLRDCVSAEILTPDQPIYFIELGAGTGRLTYHFLHQFYDRFLDSPFADLPIKFILTDFVPSILDFWQAHPQLQPWVEAGLLDFALFDVTDMQPLTLVHSGQTLTPADIQNPLILFANYFFDSIPQDSFTIEDGLLNENLLSLLSTQPEPDLSDPQLWERLSLAYEAIPLQAEPYENDLFNHILESYAAQLPDTTLSFPAVGLYCLQFWQQFGHGRGLLLTSDRGYSLPDSLIGQPDPLPNLHGSFSMMVNYHAISEHVELSGGAALVAPHYQDNLQTVAYLLGERPANGSETAHAFTSAVVQHGVDDFFALKQIVELQVESLTLPQLLSFLRLSAWDADLFRDCFGRFLALCQTAEPAWHPDIYDAVAAIWTQYLPLQANDKLLDLVNQLLVATNAEPITMVV